MKGKWKKQVARYWSKRILIRNREEIKEMKQVLQSSCNFNPTRCKFIQLQCNHTHTLLTQHQVCRMCQAFRPHPHLDILPYEPTTPQHLPPTPSCWFRHNFALLNVPNDPQLFNNRVNCSRNVQSFNKSTQQSTIN